MKLQQAKPYIFIGYALICAIITIVIGNCITIPIAWYLFVFAGVGLFLTIPISAVICIIEQKQKTRRNSNVRGL